VAVHLHFAPYIADDALAVNEEGRALDAHVLPAVHALLDPNPISLADLAVGIGGKRKGQGELRLELVVARNGIARNADDRGLDFGEVGKGVAKSASLRRAARRVVLGVEIERT
jgi:hypothetical protein